MDILEITSLDRLEALAPEWWDLWQRCPQATVFQSPAWLLPWWRHVWGGGRIWALALRDRERLAGLAPFFFYGLPRHRRLSLAGAGISDYLDVLLEPEWTARGGELIWQRIWACRDEWDDFDFQELREGSALLASGPAAEPCACCPVLELPGSWEELMARIPSKLRTGVRRARNRLARAGAVRVESNRLELMDELFRLHEARWRERGESGVICTPGLQRHYRETASALRARGMLRLYGLRIDGAYAAVLFAFAARERVCAYLDGFDPALARWSPGSVLLGMAIERAIAEGMREFDFLRQSEDFKYQWGARDRVNHRIARQSSTSRAA